MSIAIQLLALIKFRSTAARTRLYKMGINKYFEIVETDFEIYGEMQNEWELYVKGKNYQAFIIQRKKT